MATSPAPTNEDPEWIWEDWAIVEHALGELLHIGSRSECFDKAYRQRICELLEDAKKKTERA